MNKILFGGIGLLFLGVIGTGMLAMKATSDTGIPAIETRAIQHISDPNVKEAFDSSEHSSPVPPSPAPSLNPEPTPHPVPKPTPSPTPQPGVYTMAQVAAHNSEASCYTAVEGFVYDVTPFVHEHPGGARAILSLCGKDGTRAFEGQHGGEQRPAAELASFKIGRLSA